MQPRCQPLGAGSATDCAMCGMSNVGVVTYDVMYGDEYGRVYIGDTADTK